MSRLKTIEANRHKIITMDYRGCKEKDMMIAATALKDAIAAEGKPVGVLAQFDDKTYVTGAFMRHAEKETAQVIDLIEDSAFVGLSKTKKFILLGYNLLFRKHFKAFETTEEAIQYLSEKVAVKHYSNGVL